MSLTLQHSSFSDDVEGCGPGMDDQVQWYQAETCLGSVSIGVVVGDKSTSLLAGPHRVLQQGLLLAEIELIVQAIELWLEVELDLIPGEVMNLNTILSAESAEILEALIQPVAGGALPDVYLRLPLQSLDRIKTVDSVLTDQLHFQWSPVKFELTLEEMSLTQFEMADVEVGALILLPTSFDVPWTVYGSVATLQGFRLTGGLNPNTSALEHPRLVKSRDPGFATDQAGDQVYAVSIRSERTCLFNPGELFGFHSMEQPLLPAIEKSDLTLEYEGQTLGRGRLTQVARGYGFVLFEMSA